MHAVQVLKSLQALAASDELRFEVSKQTALAFLVKRTPADLPQLAQAISKRHGIVSRQQAHRLDLAYCSFAAAGQCPKAAEGSQVCCPSVRDRGCSKGAFSKNVVQAFQLNCSLGTR